MNSNSHPKISGVLAEFASIKQLTVAVRTLIAAGYDAIHAYSPYFDEELDKALPSSQSWIPLYTLIGGILGGTGMYFLQYWINIYAYPLNVGGRPLHSWPAFIPATFEMSILLAALTCFVTLWASCHLPRLHHPLFEIPRFRSASDNAFFLYLEIDQPANDQQHADVSTARERLLQCGAIDTWEISDAT